MMPDTRRRPSRASRHGSSASFAFPPQNFPRTWLFTASFSPLHTRLMRALLAHGDCVAACLPPSEMDDPVRSASFRELVAQSRSRQRGTEGWSERLKGIRCDGRFMGECGAAVAEAVGCFGRLDVVLCCSCEVLVSSLEALASTPATMALVEEQFDSVCYSQINFITAAVSTLRRQRTGHILVLTSTASQVCMAGLSVFGSAQRALEAYAASLAYHVMYANVRVTIVQPDVEVQALTSRVIFAPAGGDARRGVGEVLERAVFGDRGVRSRRRLDPQRMDAAGGGGGGGGGMDDTGGGGASSITRGYARLAADERDKLVLETAHAIAALGGHENPPTRYVVGADAANELKERVRLEMEDLAEWSKFAGDEADGEDHEYGHEHNVEQDVDVDVDDESCEGDAEGETE